MVSEALLIELLMLASRFIASELSKALTRKAKGDTEKLQALEDAAKRLKDAKTNEERHAAVVALRAALKKRST